MAKKDTSRSFLGLTQQEIALLLKVTRSQWSHYEASTRSLPNGAGIRFLEMLSYMILPETEALRHASMLKHEESKTKPTVQKRLKKTEYQLMVISRKIADVQEKFEKYSKSVQLMDFLNSPEEVKKAASLKALSSITSRALANYTESKSELRLLQLDQKLLLQEKLVLEEELKKDS